MSESNETRITAEDGSSYIPSSRRPDGTWRKAIKVKSGYVPQDEVPAYESKGRLFLRDKPTYPVGLPHSFITSPSTSKQKNKPVVAQKVVPSSGLTKRGRGHKTASDSTFADKPSQQSERLQQNVQSNVQDSPNPVLSKKIRTIQRKIKDIEVLEQKIQNGLLPSPEKNQLEKMSRKPELEDELLLLETELASLAV